MDLAHASLNSATIRQANLSTVVDLAAGAGFGHVALWRDVYEGVGADGAARLLADSGLGVSSICRGGMFVQGDALSRRRQADDNRRAVDEAAALQARCLVLVCGGVDGTDIAGARHQIRDGIQALLPHAAAAGVALAVEPMHPMMAADRSAITSLTEALDLVESLDPNLGIALDSYHVWWDASMEREIARAGERLLGVQVSDWILPIFDQLSSRGMPGAGSIDLSHFLECVVDAGFDAPVEVEVLNATNWLRPPEEVVAEAARAMTQLPDIPHRPAKNA